MKLEVAASSHSTNYSICKIVLGLFFSLAHRISGRSSQSQAHNPYPFLSAPSDRHTNRQTDRQTSFLHASMIPQAESTGSAHTEATADTGVGAEAQWSWTTHSRPSQNMTQDPGQHHNSTSTFDFDAFRVRTQLWCGYIARNQLQIASPWACSMEKGSISIQV